MMIDSVEHSFNTVNLANKADYPRPMVFTNSDKIKQLVAAQQQGSSLGQPFYQDIDVYHAEITNIFLKHWLFAGMCRKSLVRVTTLPLSLILNQ